jgi:hypothetical protein
VCVQAKEDASAEIAACEEIDKNRILAEVRGLQRLPASESTGAPLTLYAG